MQTFYTAEVQAALAIRKARTAEYLALPPTQRAAVDQVNDHQQQISHLHRVRAKAAYMAGKKAPRAARHRREAPTKSRQYATVSTEAARDPRLCSTAVSLLQVVAALAGREGSTDARNGQLAGAIKKSVATVKRHIHDLVEYGYLEHRTIYNARGSVICRRLTPTERVWPEWHRHRKNPHGACKLRPAPPITPKFKKEERQTEISGEGGQDCGSNVAIKYVPPRRSETTD